MNKPISRAHAVSNTSAEVDRLVDEVVGIANKKLINFVEGSTVRVNVSRQRSDVSSDIFAKMKQRVIDLYKAEGWKVTFDYGSQRDESCDFVFS